LLNDNKNKKDKDKEAHRIEWPQHKVDCVQETPANKMSYHKSLSAGNITTGDPKEKDAGKRNKEVNQGSFYRL
jgi:hypothetical protein